MALIREIASRDKGSIQIGPLEIRTNKIENRATWTVEDNIFIIITELRNVQGGAHISTISVRMSLM